MAARNKKRMSAQVAEDEDCQLHYEKVAGIDVAKGLEQQRNGQWR